MMNPCGCLNGGKCINTDLLICECTGGFVGEQCEEVFIDFAYRNKFPENAGIIAIVTVVLLVFFASIVFCFLAWRRIKSIIRRREEMSTIRNRRQSKATIEGSSFMPRWETHSQCSNSSNEIDQINCQDNRTNTIVRTCADVHLIVDYSNTVEV